MQSARRVGDRPRALPRPRPRRPTTRMALDGRPLSGTTGAVLDPILSLRHRVRLRAGRLRARLVRDRRRPRTATPRSRSRRSTTTRRRPRAPSRSRSTQRADRAAPPRHLRSRRRSSTSGSPRACFYADASLRAGARDRCARERARPVRALGARHLGRPADPRWCACVEADDLPLVRQVLQAQEYWRLKGLRADVVVLNEHPVELPRRDARAARRAARERPVGAPGRTSRAASSCCAATAWPSAERVAARRRSRAPC